MVIPTYHRPPAVPFSHVQVSHGVTTSARRVADWFAQLNEKMGGDLKKIKVVGQYMIEIWKACGMEGIDSNQVPEQAPARRAVGLRLCSAPAAGWQASVQEQPSCSGGMILAGTLYHEPLLGTPIYALIMLGGSTCTVGRVSPATCRAGSVQHAC